MPSLCEIIQQRQLIILRPKFKFNCSLAILSSAILSPRNTHSFVGHEI